LFPEVIRPALSDRKGWALFIGTPKGHNAFEILRRKVFDLVDAGFHTRRKMARQSLSGVLGSVAEASALMESVGLRPDSRCETWSLNDFVALAHAWKK